MCVWVLPVCEVLRVCFFGGTDYFVRTPPGNLIRKAVMMIAIRINYKEEKEALDGIPRRETNHGCSDEFPAIKQASKAANRL